MATTAPEPNANVPRPLGEMDLHTKDEAMMLLQAHGCTVTKIQRVHLDSILYLGASERPMTAWLTRHPGRIEVRTESGWKAEPACGLLPRPDLATMYPDAQD
jgi:hypothetical protein